MVLGISQLLETVGRATAAAMSASSVPFVAIPGELHHALDYIPDESDFWQLCVDELFPLVVTALTDSVASG